MFILYFVKQFQEVGLSWISR